MHKTIFFVVGLLLMLVLGVGGGGWYYLSMQKDTVKVEVNKQVESLGKVNDRVQSVSTIYQQLGEQQSNDSVKVLGAQSKNLTPREDILEKSQQVLGIEDSQSLKQSRDIIEIMTQTEEELLKLNSSIKRISDIGGLNLFSSVYRVDLPIAQTQTYIDKITPIVDVLKTAEEIGIEANKTGFDLGATLAVALQRADEESIKKLEMKISELNGLVDQEASLSEKDVPEELKKILRTTNAQSVQVVAGFEDLPDIIRKKDVLGLQKAISDMQVDVVVESEKIKVDLVSFMRSDETIRSATTLLDQWKELSSRL